MHVHSLQVLCWLLPVFLTEVQQHKQIMHCVSCSGRSSVGTEHVVKCLRNAFEPEKVFEDGIGTPYFMLHCCGDMYYSHFLFYFLDTGSNTAE